MPASIGHNNPPFDFFAFFDAIVSSSASAQQKLIQLVIARQAQKAGGSARPRRADVLHQASCSEATFKRAYDLLKVGFNVTPHRGSTTEYAPRECVTVEQIEAAIARMPHKTRAQGDTSFGKSGGHRARVSVNPGSPSDGLGDTSFAKSGDHGDTKSKERSPHTPLKENNIYNNHPSREAEREGGAVAGKEEIQGLNGATAHIVKTLGEWINPLMPDHRTARGWLESSISMYGGTVVRDSFAELEAKVMHGDIIARPIPLLTKICQRRKNDDQKTARSRSGTQSSYSLSGNYTGKLL